LSSYYLGLRQYFSLFIFIEFPSIEDIMGKLPVREPPVPLSRRTEALLEISKVLIPVLASVITAGWIAFQYFGSQHAETDARLREAQKPFNDIQLKTYQEAAGVAGVLATESEGDPAFTEAKKRFYALYWSGLSLVEDRQVEVAMIYLERTLRNYKAASSPHREVRDRVYCLAHAMKMSVETTWRPNSKDGPPLSPGEETARKNCDKPAELSEAVLKLNDN
jgi:hypothetical protein